MSFKESFNWAVAAVTAGFIIIYGGWYALRLAGGTPVEGALPVVVAYLAWFILLTLAASVFAARDPEGAEEGKDERDKTVNMLAALPTMHIYGFALTGLIVAMFFFDLDKWQALHGVVAIQLAATLFEAGAKIHFYRMPI